MAKPTTIEGVRYEIELRAGERLQCNGVDVEFPKRIKVFVTFPAKSILCRLDSQGQVLAQFKPVGSNAIAAAETG